MGISTYTPLFAVQGFGPLGLSTNPADYGVNAAFLSVANAPISSGPSSAYLTLSAGGSPVSIDRPERGLSGLWAAGDRKPGSVPPATTPGSGVSRISPKFSLKFTSGRLRSTEFFLEEGKPVIIGRKEGSDITLDEAGVSSKHAKLTLSGQEVTLEDLGSTGGTFVSGEKVKKSRVLKEGDRIMIGSSMLTLAISRDFAPLENTSRAPATATEKPSPPKMRGTITEMPLPDLLQLFEGSRKTGLLRMRGNAPGDAASEGEIHLREGRVVFASVGGREKGDPRKAFYRIVTWQEGEFELTGPVAREFPVEIEESIQGLLMEGFRIMDEMGNLGPDRPSLTASVAADLSWERPLEALGKPELAVLQAVLMGGGTVQDVLDRSPKDDIETTKVLTDLIRKGYVRVTQPIDE